MLLFSRVAEIFKQIEDKAGRLEMTSILCELLKESTPKDVEKLIYILQGILAPPYEGIDLGLGEQFAIRAISNASGYSPLVVEKKYKELGDLGLVAESLIEKRKQHSLSTQEMDVLSIHAAFVKIAKTQGKGSQDLKIKLLTELLNNANALEARYIVRFVTGTLRLGIGDPTICDALSFWKAGDKSMREYIERAYNNCSDLGYVARLFMENEKNLEHFTVQPFKPLQPALAERLATPKEIIERLGPCSVEKKFDGFRVQCHKKGNEVELYSRKLERMTHMFPDLVESLKRLKAKDIIFEGEALGYNEAQKRYLSFQETMHRRRKHGVKDMSKEIPLKVFCFDLIYKNGIDYTSKPYHERRIELEHTFPFEGFELSPKEDVVSEKQLDDIFKESIKQGLEGIMAKDVNAPYTAGKRKFAWIKLKKGYGQAIDSIDGVIVGYFLGKGARVEFEFGGLLVAVFNEDTNRLETLAKIGSGYTEEEMRTLKEMLEEMKQDSPPKDLDFNEANTPDVWVKPTYVIEIAYDDITQSPTHTCGLKEGRGYALRFPRMLKLRSDKSIHEITTSQEVAHLFSLQSRKASK